MRHIRGTLLVVVALLAGCTTGVADPPPTRVSDPPVSTDLMRQWFIGAHQLTLCRATLEFAMDGSIYGSTGLQAFAGSWHAENDKLTISEITAGSLLTGCERDEFDPESLVGAQLSVTGRVLKVGDLTLKTSKTSAETLAPALVGLPEDYAIRLVTGTGLQVRVVTIDGTGQTITDDLRPDRINLDVEDGVVTKAEVY